MTARASGWMNEVRWRLKLLRLAHRSSLDARRSDHVAYVRGLSTCYQLYSRHGFLPDEAQRLGLVSSPGDVERRFISKSRLVRCQRVLNHPSFQELTEDKALFYAACARMGIATPRLLALFLRGASGLQWAGTPLMGEQAWRAFFEQECPDEFVVKPSRGVYGNGIVFVDRQAGPFSGGELYRTLNAAAEYDSFVVQDLVQNHPDLLALSPARGLQTLRVITFVRQDLGVDVLMAYLKPVVGSNRIDNHNSGRTGNLLCPIDVRTGVLGDLQRVTDVGVETLHAHPDTGAGLKGRTVPIWPDVVALAETAARAFLPMRAIGWDIAITPDGPMCIEGNARWDPPKFGDVTALRPVLAAQAPDVRS